MFRDIPGMGGCCVSVRRLLVYAQRRPYRDTTTRSIIACLPKRPSVSAVPDLIQQPGLPSPLLIDRRPDMLRRQHKPALARRPRPQLQRPRVIRPKRAVVEIPPRPRREVQHLARGADRVLVPALGEDGGRDALADLAHARQRLGQVLGLAAPAPGREDELRVRVPVDVGADALAGGRELGRERREDLVLGRVAGGEPLEGLGAGVG
jgi:hypothetical protein